VCEREKERERESVCVKRERVCEKVYVCVRVCVLNMHLTATFEEIHVCAWVCVRVYSCEH